MSKIQEVEKAESETGEKEIEIGFGTLFTFKSDEIDPESIGVVTDPGEEDWFFCSRLFKEEDGTGWFYRQFTGGLRDIGEIIGQLSLEEVIAAARKGFELKATRLKSEKVEDYINSLREDAQIKPRKIELG